MVLECSALSQRFAVATSLVWPATLESTALAGVPAFVVALRRVRRHMWS